MPISLPSPWTCILAGCPQGGIVLDPFSGIATTGLAALKIGRKYLGIELSAIHMRSSYKRAALYYPLLMAEANLYANEEPITA